MVFSSTPYKMGRFIRIMTRDRYNHISVMLDENMSEAYTFGRKHRDTPLWGGIVKDSVSRYDNKGNLARINVCRISLEDGQYDEVKENARKMFADRDRYIYNLLSATIAPLKKRYYVEDAYTCVEFCIYLLAKHVKELQDGEFYTVDEVYDRLGAYSVYSGEFNINGERDKEFETLLGRGKNYGGAYRIIRELLKRRRQG